MIVQLRAAIRHSAEKRSKNAAAIEQGPEMVIVVVDSPRESNGLCIHERFVDTSFM
ncbi:hypothetical protein [Burkholderia cepacia]|uniref:hypothetical protein n=1 Tax=Burkholderia cepacia TaxID=292 RepID=UPI001CF388D5|nr:hypothetical protein [Burkholderia cepacia]MCA8348485.1 hypothetical protein [Burkholderia cepacia]